MVHEFGKRLAALVFLVGAGCVFSQAGAYASALPASHHHDGYGSYQSMGNGTHNTNSFLVNSPNFSHDIQHARNANIGGVTISPQALCHHRVRCKIVQRIAVYDPW